LLGDRQRLEDIFSTLLKKDGQLLLFCDVHLFVKLYTAFGEKLVFRHHQIWQKPGGMPVNPYRPISETEMIAVFKHKDAKVSHLTFNPYDMGEDGKPYVKRNGIRDIPTRRMKKSIRSINKDGRRYPKTIIQAPSKPNMTKMERTSHPTQKPLSLLKKLILGYSNPHDLILDPFSGSGSTHLACWETGRSAIGYELDRDIHLEAIERINAHTSQTRLFN